MADELVKEAASDGSPTDHSAPKIFLKTQHMWLSISRWQAECCNGETGRSIYFIVPKISNKEFHWSRECIQFATDHESFPSYLKRFNLHPTDKCGCGETGDFLHFATILPLNNVLPSQETKSSIHSPMMEYRSY
ncbi:hypothetical protein AVEN_115033-1 [Araneus ventricosus]|uniref:Uncharacterized protein n=1 Tax=Araneus ventricosus TaxID=182803 RepID=A0A4Y1ZY68_ARAVE|nr:hypothetical protein AVEN_115033-1 [Araneus ventricosus]